MESLVEYRKRERLSYFQENTEGITMPADPAGGGRQWVGHWYRRGHVTRRGYAIPPGWGEGTAEHTHTRHDGGGATTAYLFNVGY